MKRRSFLGTIAGVFGAVAVGAKVKPAPAVLAKPTQLSLAQFINEGHTFIGLSRVTYPDLNAPVLDAHGPALTVADIERFKKMIKEKVR